MLTCWILVLLSQLCQGRNGMFSDVQSVYLEKLDQSAKSLDIRPTQDMFMLTPVFIYCIIQDFEIHSIENKMDVNTLFFQSWGDNRISWNTTQFPLEFVWMKEKKLSIWTPTILLRNSIGQKSNIDTSSHIIGQAFYESGDIYLYGKKVFKSQCFIDMTYFPFDTQECSFEITSNPKEVYLFGQCTFENANTEWTNVQVTTEEKAVSSEMKCTIKARRKSKFLVFNLLIPTVLIGFLNVFVFIIPANAGEKLQYSVAILLSFNVYLGILVDKVPANSDKMSILSYYIIYQYVFGVIAILCTVVLLRTIHVNNRKEVPGHLVRMVKIVRIWNCKKKCWRNVSHDDNQLSSEEKSFKHFVSWRSVCATFDFLLFWVFLLIQIIGNMYFFLSIR